jgi:hypothetical protein
VKLRNRNIPQDANILEWHGFLGFPTRIRYQLTNMEQVEWVSRRSRKRRRLPFTGQTRAWWESERISQWMCVLFMIGSFAFAAGALLCFDLSLPVIVPSVIFFVGSLFFTSAAYLQFLEATNVPDTSAISARAGETNQARYFAWEPDRIDWWSTITQLVGTLYFNFSTFNAMRMNLSLTKIDRLVWSADFLGSVLFLVSSWLAYGEVASALSSPKLKSLTWWVVLSNLLGSVAFGVSAITSFVLPSVGTMINANVTNLFTALGGVCFFVGALLQLLETNRENAGVDKDASEDRRIAHTSHLIEGHT